MKVSIKNFIVASICAVIFSSCGKGNDSKSKNGAIAGNAAERVYVKPGEHDEFYAFLSGGFNGQLSVYGLPSGRLFKNIPVFSQDGEKGY